MSGEEQSTESRLVSGAVQRPQQATPDSTDTSVNDLKFEVSIDKPEVDET